MLLTFSKGIEYFLVTCIISDNHFPLMGILECILSISPTCMYGPVSENNWSLNVDTTEFLIL
jgi:hypothetical protein